MKKNITILFVSIILFGCINTNNTTTTKDNVVSFNQQQLLDAGWSSSPNRLSRDLSVDFGITPIYGIIDNYFDVRMGNGSDLVLKIIDLSKNKCIRYIYVTENSEYTISQIPPGKYKLLIAYGRNWMIQQKNGIFIGRFADNVYYEQSVDVFDFGRKNTLEMVNYLLTINVQNNLCDANFNTERITEAEFYDLK